RAPDVHRTRVVAASMTTIGVVGVYLGGLLLLAGETFAVSESGCGAVTTWTVPSIYGPIQQTYYAPACTGGGGMELSVGAVLAVTSALGAIVGSVMLARTRTPRARPPIIPTVVPQPGGIMASAAVGF